MSPGVYHILVLLHLAALGCLVLSLAICYYYTKKQERETESTWTPWIKTYDVQVRLSEIVTMIIIIIVVILSFLILIFK